MIGERGLDRERMRVREGERERESETEAWSERKRQSACENASCHLKHSVPMPCISENVQRSASL